MAKKLQAIYEMYFSFDPFVELSYAFRTDDNKYSKDEQLVDQFSDCFKHKPLAKKWKSVAVLRKDSDTADFVAVGTRFAASSKAKKILEKAYGDILEFLPLEVVGKLVEDDDDEYEMVIKPVRKKETFYLLNPIAKITIGERSEYEKFPACKSYHFCEFDEEQIETTPIFRPKHAMTILVTEQFKSLVEKKKLNGLSFERDRRVDWEALPKTGSAKPTKAKSKKASKSKPPKPIPFRAAASKEPQSAEIPQPASCEVLYGATHQRMTKKLWKALSESWNWSCDVAKACGENPIRPRISKPISKLQLEKLRKKVGHRLPAEFEHVLVNYSRKVDFFWSLDEAGRVLLNGKGEQISGLDTPEDYEASLMGGCLLWDISLLPDLAEAARNHESSGWLAFKEGLRGRLPFLHVGNGDLIAFDMRNGYKNCPIVYLNHDNEPEYNDRRIGDNFVDFLANWSSVGCVGPEIWSFDVFYNKRQRKISAAGRHANRWRKFMATGK